MGRTTKRRRVLLTIAVLGSVVTLLGLVGLIAPFTDRATTGTNSIQSGARAREADLQLATTDVLQGCVNAGPFADDLTTGVISASNVQPTQSPQAGTPLCLMNAGSSLVSVSFTALDLADIDVACTGDEAVVDATCVSGAVGELSPQLDVGFNVSIDAQCNGPGNPVLGRLDSLTTTSVGLVPVAAGQTICLTPIWAYSPLTGTDAATMAQTDQATWRFAFDGATQ